MTRHAEALARRLASPCDRGRAPLGAPPWRFLGLRVRVSGSVILLRSACSDAPRSRVLVSGERFPCLPRLPVTSRQPRNTTPRSAFRTSPETPLMSEDDSNLAIRRRTVNIYISWLYVGPSL